MCPLWNRSSSIASSGGISTRTGSNTEQIFNNQSAPTQSTSSSTGGWLSKAFNKVKDFVSNHSEGIGKAANAIGMIGATAIGGPTGLAAYTAAKNIAGTIGDNFKGSKFQKFTKGLEDKQITNTTNKAYNIYKNGSLSKVEKFNQFNDLINEYKKEPNMNKSIIGNVVANTSNGHVPSGYQATSSQGASISTNKKAKAKKSKKGKKK